MQLFPNVGLSKHSIVPNNIFRPRLIESTEQDSMPPENINFHAKSIGPTIEENKKTLNLDMPPVEHKNHSMNQPNPVHPESIRILTHKSNEKPSNRKNLRHTPKNQVTQLDNNRNFGYAKQTYPFTAQPFNQFHPLSAPPSYTHFPVYCRVASSQEAHASGMPQPFPIFYPTPNLQQQPFGNIVHPVQVVQPTTFPMMNTTPVNNNQPMSDKCSEIPDNQAMDLEDLSKIETPKMQSPRDAMKNKEKEEMQIQGLVTRQKSPLIQPSVWKPTVAHESTNLKPKLFQTPRVAREHSFRFQTPVKIHRPNLVEEPVDKVESSINAFVSPKPKEVESSIKSIDPCNISLSDDNPIELEKLPLNSASASPAHSTTSSSTRPQKRRHVDPETGLTYETLRKRKLASRYSELLHGRGLEHRLHDLSSMTNIQIASLLNRSQRHLETCGVSEALLGHIFEEREVNRSKRHKHEMDKESDDFQNTLQEKYNNICITNDSDLLMDDVDFMFEIVEKEEDESVGAHQALNSEAEYYEMRRSLMSTDQWLANFKQRLIEKQTKAMEKMEYLCNSSNYEFLDSTEFDSSDEHCARCRPIQILCRQPMRQIDHERADFRFNLFDRFGYVPNSLDTKIEKHVEELALQIELESLEDEPEDLPSSEEPVESLKLKKRLAFPSLNPFVESDDSSTNNSSMASISPSSSVETDPQTFKNSKPGNTKKSDAIVGQYQTPTYEKSSLDLLEKPNRTKVFKKPSKSKKSILMKGKSIAKMPKTRKRHLLDPIPELNSLKSLEYNLKRYATDYSYKNIDLPSVRAFNLDEHIEKGKERKLKTLKLSQLPCPLNESEKKELGKTPAKFFARLHHQIEYKKPALPHVFNYNEHKHEEPTKTALYYHMVNKSKPFPALFHPGIKKKEVKRLHREPRYEIS